MLRGNAFLIMWHDIAPEGEDDYHHWHTKQHMVERVSHPGFRRSRRGVNWELDRQRYFTLYEGDELGTFTSEAYLASLNGPTEWTNEMAPQFRNFLRCACQTAYSGGHGVGGALATFRGNLPAGSDEQGFLEALLPDLDQLIEQPRVSGVHLGFARREFSNSPTRETQLRPAMREGDFEFVVVVESYGLREISRIAPDVLGQIERAGGAGVLAQCYDLAFTIEDADLLAESAIPKTSREDVGTCREVRALA